MSHLRAVLFARAAHRDQVRKYTGAPYTDHLAEVAALVLATGPADPSRSGSVAWLHDTVEDTPVTIEEVEKKFGSEVALGVRLLTDTETGNRAARKTAARLRLAGAPAWVQTIKIADIISNTASIVQHDPKFAAVYLSECHALWRSLDLADGGLRQLAFEGLALGQLRLDTVSGTD